MARTKRMCPAGEVFHVLNPAVARLTLSEKPEDFAASMRIVEETWKIVPLPIYTMVDIEHIHLTLRPRPDVVKGWDPAEMARRVPADLCDAWKLGQLKELPASEQAVA